MKQNRTRSDAFIIRIWREDSRPGWRGRVQHAPSGEYAFVRDLDELLAFIERWTGKLESPARRGLK